LSFNYNVSYNSIYNKLRRHFGADFKVENKESIIERHTVSKELSLKDFRKMLKDESCPIWYIRDMYQGIEKDKENMSVGQLSLKYGTTETRIKAIITSKLWEKNI
jgi:CRISPR/Cas system type I-B associated protein Csh2 (Cas7 group RAMP superfamily)